MKVAGLISSIIELPMYSAQLLIKALPEISTIIAPVVLLIEVLKRVVSSLTRVITDLGSKLRGVFDGIIGIVIELGNHSPDFTPGNQINYDTYKVQFD